MKKFKDKMLIKKNGKIISDRNRFVWRSEDLIIYDKDKKCIYDIYYYKKLANIFRHNFLPNNKKQDYWKQKACEFVCENYQNCCLTPESPKYTSCPGDIATEIMVIGEAPSGTIKNGGGIIGGYFKDVAASNKSPLYIVKEFCQKNYNQIPYFTDYCKCGVTKQINKKNLKLRFKNCFNTFLINEIEFIKPKLIFALGNSVYILLKENLEKIKSVGNKNVKLIKLLHYSNRGTLPLSPKDKMNIIWRYQAGFKNYNLSNLDFFNKKLDI